jgi:hypothetical protein
MYQEAGGTFDSKRRKYKPSTTSKIITFLFIAKCFGFRKVYNQVLEMHEER